MPAVRTPEASRTLTVSCPGILPSPLRDKVGAFHHDRFRGYVSVHFRSGLHPPCLRFAVAVAGHHARLGTPLLVRLCRGRHRRRLNSMRLILQGATPHESGRARPRLPQEPSDAIATRRAKAMKASSPLSGSPRPARRRRQHDRRRDQMRETTTREVRLEHEKLQVPALQVGCTDGLVANEPVSIGFSPIGPASVRSH